MERPASDPSGETLRQPASSRSLAGRRIATYQVEAEIGRGGMGVVYKARDLTLDRTVALKVLAPKIGLDEEFEQRFLREAKAAAQLDHPRIVQVFAAGKDGDVAFMAMQFVAGRTLSSLLRERGPLPVEEALRLTRDVAEALATAHARGVVHRDIKPSNIMVDTDGHARVMDFGLARAGVGMTGGAAGNPITLTGTYLGTPEYSSPEQCETHDVDGRSDLYSLGVVLYQMLTGDLPFKGETPLTVFRKIAEEPHPPVQTLRPDVPAGVPPVLDRLLAKKREDRYPGAVPLIDDLKRLLGETVERTVLLGARPAAAAGGMRRRLSIAAAALLIGAAGALGAWQVFTPPAVPDPDGGSHAYCYKPPAAVDAPPTVIVFDFKNGSRNPECGWLEMGIAEMILGRLGEEGRFNPIARDVLVERMRQQTGRRVGFSDSPGIPDKAPIVLGSDVKKVLSCLGGRYVISGVFFAPTGGKIRIQAELFEVNAAGQGTLTRVRQVHKDGTEEDVLALVDQVADALAAAVPGSEKRQASGLVAGAPAQRENLGAVQEQDEECSMVQSFLAYSNNRRRQDATGGAELSRKAKDAGGERLVVQTEGADAVPRPIEAEGFSDEVALGGDKADAPAGARADLRGKGAQPASHAPGDDSPSGAVPASAEPAPDAKEAALPGRTAPASPPAPSAPPAVSSTGDRPGRRREIRLPGLAENAVAVLDQMKPADRVAMIKICCQALRTMEEDAFKNNVDPKQLEQARKVLNHFKKLRSGSVDLDLTDLLNDIRQCERPLVAPPAPVPAAEPPAKPADPETSEEPGSSK